MGETSSRDKEFVSYLHFDVYVTKLVEMIKNSEIFPELKFVFGVPNGGLPISVHLSHYLNLKHLISFNRVGCADSTLIVDDISHTGITLEGYKKLGFKYFATLYHREESTIKPNFYVRIAKKWIVFPWEKPDEIPNRPE